MSKLLMAGLIAAVAVSGAQAESTQCHPGGFYAGLGVGWIHHNAKMKVKEDSVKTDAAAILTDMEKLIKYYQALVTTATTAETTAQTALTSATDAAKAAMKAELIDRYKVVDNASGVTYDEGNSPDIGLGSIVANIATRNYAAQTALSAAVLYGAYTDATAALNNAANLSIQNADNRATAIKEYNDAITANINKIVDNLFAGTAQTGIDLSAGTFTYATGSTVNFGNDLKAKTTTYNTALTAKDTATAAKTTATGYQTAFVTHYTNNITGAKATFDAIAETDGVKKHAAAIDAAEHSELGLNASGTKSKSKSGFIAEAVVGYDHRMSDVMVGVDLGIGFDTFKTTIKDKSPATASTTTTKNGVEVKRPFYVLVLPRVGYMFTPQLEGYITAGVSLNRYKVDTRGMAVVHDKYNALVTQGKALNTLRTTKITELTAKIANTSTSADDKKKAEADLKIYTDSPIITGLKTDEVNAAQQKVHKKTKLAPVVGAGVRFAVTPDVLIGLGYRYQFKTKLVDFEKTGNVKVDDQSHTFKFDVLFRIGD